MDTLKIRSLKRKARKLLHFTWLRVRDRFVSPYAIYGAELKVLLGKPLVRYVAAGTKFSLSSDDHLAVALFCDHRFDLLGSGWITVSHGMVCRGLGQIKYPSVKVSLSVTEQREHFIGRQIPTSRTYAKSLWKMLPCDYRSIDWHIDFKSGYRWLENTWYRDIRYGAQPGADVKVPWELSRLQHLVELALGFASNNDDALLSEYQNQILDWIASNPPRYGVNWACTMDVAIRMANCLIAYDILKSAGAKFSSSFDSVLVSMTLQHGLHIVNNLEWSEERRSNHYLANICGLLVISAYLPTSRLTDSWLLFAIQELETETLRQFLEDGGHFESSTSYHRLCGEMVAVAGLFALALPMERISKLLHVKPNAFTIEPGIRKDVIASLRQHLAQTSTVFSPAFFERIARAQALTKALMRSDGSVPIIGDNDSGRFVRCGGWFVAGQVDEVVKSFANLANYDGLAPDQPYLMQTPASHVQWLAWCSAILDNFESSCPKVTESVSRTAIDLASSILRRPSAPAGAASYVTASALEQLSVRYNNMLLDDQSQAKTISFCLQNSIAVQGLSLLDGLTVLAFQQCGIYIYRSTRIHLVIRCGNALADGSGAHAHDDQLSFDLTIDGVSICADPGSFVYTASPANRDKYRNAGAHTAPLTRQLESNIVYSYEGIFCSPNHPVGICLKFNATEFVGLTTVGGGYVVRTFTICATRLVIKDEYYLEASYVPAQIDPFMPANIQVKSGEYGWH